MRWLRSSGYLFVIKLIASDRFPRRRGRGPCISSVHWASCGPHWTPPNSVGWWCLAASACPCRRHPTAARGRARWIPPRWRRSSRRRMPRRRHRGRSPGRPGPPASTATATAPHGRPPRSRAPSGSAGRSWPRRPSRPAPGSTRWSTGSWRCASRARGAGPPTMTRSRAAAGCCRTSHRPTSTWARARSWASSAGSTTCSALSWTPTPLVCAHACATKPRSARSPRSRAAATGTGWGWTATSTTGTPGFTAICWSAP